MSVAFLVSFGPRVWPLGSQMIELGCPGTDLVGGNDKEVLDAILLWEGLILATLGMDKRNCAYVGCISGWFWALRVAPWVTDG